MKGVRSGPQALIAPLSAPKTPSGTAPGGTHLFRKGNQDARSLLDLTLTGPTPCRPPDPLVVHLGRATTSCTTTAIPRRTA